MKIEVTLRGTEAEELGGAAKRSTWAAGQQSGESQVSPPVDSGWKPNPWAGSPGSRYAGGRGRRWRQLR